MRRAAGVVGKRDHVLTNISTRTGAATRPGPEEEAPKVPGGRERVLEGRSRAAEPAPQQLSSAEACCSEARRPASARPPLASPNPCSSSPFAPAAVRHGKAPPPHTREPAAPNCATRFMGPGPGGVWGRGSGHIRCGRAARPAEESDTDCPGPTSLGPLDPNPPASPTAPAASRPCLCCSWWL